MYSLVDSHSNVSCVKRKYVWSKNYVLKVCALKQCYENCDETRKWSRDTSMFIDNTPRLQLLIIPLAPKWCVVEWGQLILYGSELFLLECECDKICKRLASMEDDLSSPSSGEVPLLTVSQCEGILCVVSCFFS